MKLILKLIFLNLIYFTTSSVFIVDPGPKVIASKGAVWPKPKKHIISTDYSVVRASILRFQVIGHDCDILENARARYLQIIGKQASLTYRGYKKSNFTEFKYKPRQLQSWRDDSSFKDYLDVVDLNLKTPCDSMPHLDMNESYTFKLNNTSAVIESSSVWGILRGLETFSQLLYMGNDKRSLMINLTEINDEPRFPHRGLLIDTSRHYLTLFTIFNILDGMAYNKLNVLHWHIVDDQSFPYQSRVFPELSEKGAYDPDNMIYTHEDVESVIEYARVRGIRVMSEFDTPGHTRSWGNSHPEILTQCFGKHLGKLGPIDPTKETTYEFMEKLFTEITEVFPDEFVHLGGDEVEFDCWQSNENITQFMKDKHFSQYEQLEGMYIQRLVDLIARLNASSIVWQEVYQNGVQLPNTTVVHIWSGNRRNLLRQVTQDGFNALLSTCWYLDHILGGGDWEKFYECDPHDFEGTDEQKKRVMGGEACMWSEVVDNTNVLQRIFPRVSAAAEKLWSFFDEYDVIDVSNRIEEHTCRMRFRGIPAQPPNGPGFCL